MNESSTEEVKTKKRGRPAKKAPEQVTTKPQEASELTDFDEELIEILEQLLEETRPSVKDQIMIFLTAFAALIVQGFALGVGFVAACVLFM
jgi:hypothetical protein